MYQNDWTVNRLAAEHQRELRRQAEAERVSREYVPQPRRPGRWLGWLGQQLIVTGQRLQTYHKAAMTGAALHAAARRRWQSR